MDELKRAKDDVMDLFDRVAGVGMRVAQTKRAHEDALQDQATLRARMIDAVKALIVTTRIDVLGDGSKKVIHPKLRQDLSWAMKCSEEAVALIPLQAILAILPGDQGVLRAEIESLIRTGKPSPSGPYVGEMTPEVTGEPIESQGDARGTRASFFEE